MFIHRSLSSDSLLIGNNAVADQRVVKEVLKALNTTFYCEYKLRGTEASCRVAAIRTDGGPLQDLGFVVETPSRGILLSPNRRYILIIEEGQATVLSTKTLNPLSSVSPPFGDVFGTYSDFPTFVPYGRWVSDNEVVLLEFPKYTLQQYDNAGTFLPMKAPTTQLVIVSDIMDHLVD